MIWYILGGVLLLIVLLLHLPVRVAARYQNGAFTAVVRWLFLRFPLYPGKEKKETAEKPAAPKPEKEKAAPEPQTFTQTLTTLREILPALNDGARHILRHITLAKCRISLTLAKGDAAETAIACGRANALLYAVYPLVANTIKVREFKTDVRPDYTAASGSAEAFALFRMSPATALHGGLRFLHKGGAALLNKQKKDR